MFSPSCLGQHWSIGIWIGKSVAFFRFLKSRKKYASNFFNDGEQVLAERVGDITVEHVERLGAWRGDAANLASHGLVLFGAASSLGHLLRRLGLFDTRHLVALGDKRVSVATVADLGEAAVSIVAFHESQAKFFDRNHGIHVIQLIEFAKLRILSE